MADNTITRTDAETLIPPEVSKEIIQGAIENSVCLSMFHRLADLASNQRQLNLTKALPTAGFVDGDTGLKPTSKVAWDKKVINAEEIAVIIPISENVLNDARDNGYDIFENIRPLISQAFGQVIDNAMLFGIDKPTSWRSSLFETATTQGFTVTESGDLYANILGENGVFGKVEESGFEVTGVLAGIRMKSTLRAVRDESGRPIFQSSMQDSTRYALDGAPIRFSKNGVWDNTKMKMLAGDFSQAVYAIRQDLTFKILTEGVISDSSGKVILNLAQQDSVALRCVMRLGWELPNPVNAEKPNEDERLPFAILIPNASESEDSEQSNLETQAGEQT